MKLQPYCNTFLNMLIKHLIVILLILSLSYGDEASNKVSTNFEKNLDPDGMKTKITKTLQATEIKLGSSDKKLDVLEDKCNKMSRKNDDLEEIIRKKLQKLERNLLDKLEEYIDEKFNMTERQTYRKIDAQEKKLPYKADIDELGKLQPDLNGSISCNSKMSENKPTGQLIEKIYQKLDIIQKHMIELESATTYLKLDAIDNNCTKLENNLSNTFSEIKEKIPKMVENIKQRLDALNNTTSEYLNENIKQKLDKQVILDSKGNISGSSDTLNNKLTQSLGKKLDEINKKNPELQQNISKQIEALEKTEGSVQTKTNPDSWKCKEQEVRGTDNKIFNRLDDETLNHVTFRNNSDGLVYYEMHIAIKSDSDGHILLSALPNRVKTDMEFVIELGAYNNKFTVIRHQKGGKIMAQKTTANILTPAAFTAFSFKINNGTLEVRKRNEVILSMSDARLKTIKYYSFSSWDYHYGTFLYDCPLNIQDYAI